MWFLMFAPLAAASPCTSAGIHDIVTALVDAPAESRQSIATMGVSLACHESTAIVAAAQTISESPPEMAAMADAKAILDDPTLWLSVCQNGLDVAQDVIRAAPDAKREILWHGCGLDEHPWFTKDEWTSSSGLLFLPLMAGHTMEHSDAHDKDVREVVRAMANIGGPPPVPEKVVVEAGFSSRPTVKWTGKAKKSDRPVCKVDITVRKSGDFGKIEWAECPEALRKDVEKALVDARYKAATEDGVAVKASFRTRFKVK